MGLLNQDTETVEITDAQLMQRLTHADHSAFQLIYQRHFRTVYLSAYSVLNHHNEAEDITQEVFRTLWEKNAHYEVSKGSVSSWLKTLVRNRSIDRYRSQIRHRELMEEKRHQLEPRDSINELMPDDALLRTERHQHLHSRLARLPQKTREILILSYFQELTQQQIADYLNMPLGTVKAQVRRGLEKLAIFFD